MRDPSIERYIPQLSDIFSLWTLRARIRCGGSNYDLYLMVVCILHNFNRTKSVAPGGNNLAAICYKDFLGLATINMYYYYYYYYYVSRPQFERSLLRSCGNHLERRSKWKNERRKNCQSNENQNNWQPHKGVPYFSYQTTFWDTDEPPHQIPRRVHITQLSYISLNWGIAHFRVFPDCQC